MRPGLRLAAWAVAAAVVPQPAAAAPPAPKPQRIMSMNMCTDLLLLQMVPKARVASVTYLAHDAVGAIFPGRDAGVPVNYGTAEDIIRFRPDLILAGDFSTPVTKRLARRVGAPIVEVESVNDFAGVRRILRQVGAAVGEPARAEAMIRDLDAKLAGLAAKPPARRLRVVAWSGGTSVPGKDTLANAIIEAAGGVNIAAQPGETYTTFGVEQLLVADPDALLFGGVRSGKPSLRSDEGKHRLVRRYYGDRRISYNDLGYTCGLPQSADAVVELRRALDSLPPRTWRLK